MEAITTALLTAAIVVGIVAAGGMLLGIVLVARRAKRRHIDDQTGSRALELRAGSALVQLDDAIREAEDELAFAFAQFGAPAIERFRVAVAQAKEAAREAFRLQQLLDDEVPDTPRERREWATRIAALSTTATERLSAETKDFEARRQREVDAAGELSHVRRAIEQARSRLAAERERAPGELSQDDRAVLSAATRELDGAVAAADSAAGAIAEAVVTRPAGPALRESERALARATAHLETVARARLGRAETRRSLDDALRHAAGLRAEAAKLRDAHEEAAQRDRINAAITRLDDATTAAQSNASADSRESLGRVQAAADSLDAALGAARSAQQRLEQARAALDGARRQARSELQAASDFISANRRVIGAAARTRLAESERHLALSEAESDPVAALDEARRARSRAMDADALARYDVMQRRG
ncbi:hypothetical protein [Ruicaihuangia caeni]|uniref:Uncharacterized protein n=1 Tax=Ruicaihuangia caeni TaxID=3042517 RepID=A0AAW6T7P9_9MICO|nr:hypothetical protein [Klugiella sp. YN-L-19]MDI2099249.1 hypothetical protein [Klugiella sp. YN-L-19]